MSAAWTVIVPIKGGPEAKSRLDPPPGVSRADLAAAIAADTVAAVACASAVGRVVVVCGDDAWARRALLADRSVRGRRAPVRVVAEGQGAGLNGAIEDAARGLTGPLAVILGDLPAARPADVDAVLGACIGDGFVADASGTGTTMLLSRSGRLAPRFGAESASRHAAQGASRLSANPRLVQDVDTAADLAAAALLGLGANCAALLGALALSR